MFEGFVFLGIGFGLVWFQFFLKSWGALVFSECSTNPLQLFLVQVV